MRTPRKATALLLAGGVALASVAYALGSESGNGSAVADNFPAERGGDLLAERLGVDSTELQKALRDFHDRHASARRDEFTESLADALGKSAEDVRAALDALAEDKHDRFARQLADELGIEASKVSDALEELRDERPQTPFGFAAALAGELGIEASKVEDALRALRPDRAFHPHFGREPLRGLANALDVTRAELRKALRELRADVESRIDQNRSELVEFLADRFGLSEEEVEDALPEFPKPPEPFKGPDGPHRFELCPGDGDRPGFVMPGGPPKLVRPDAPPALDAVPG
jgi:hypothetical protein